jgi:hypothetical protein
MQSQTIPTSLLVFLAFPVRAIGIYKNISEIRAACARAARKAKAAAESIQEILQITGFGSVADGASWKVLPFAISNQAIGVGTSFDGVPVIDRQILESYLGQGGCYPFARLGPGGTITDKGPFVSY